MGNVNMEARQIHYRGGEKPMSVEEALKSTAGEAAAIAQLQSDVRNLEGTKANQITIAPFFNAEESYSVGDLVYYNGLSYKCTTDHTGAWDAADFTPTTIAQELQNAGGGGSAIVYSTDEREIGEYFGKKLYEKSYILYENGVAQYTVTNNEYQIGMTGYDDVFIGGVIGVRSDAGDVYVDSGTSGAEVVVVFNKTDGSIYFTSGHAYTSFIVVVRYTKQTI